MSDCKIIDTNEESRETAVKSELEEEQSGLNIPDNTNTSNGEEVVDGQEKRPKRPNKTQRKHERYLRQVEKYKLKKKQKREAEKQKRLERAQEEKQEETSTNEKREDQNETNPEATKRLKVIQKERLIELYGKSENFDKSLKICIDCSFSEHMSDKEQSRLAQQIGRCYAINKALEKPAHLTLCNLDRSSKFYAELCRKNEGFDRYVIDISNRPIEEHYANSSCQIGYLSPDAPNFLEQLDLNTVYTIGGLVDETVSKKVTLTKCEKLNFNAYALPIEKYMGRKQHDTITYTYNKILTINQVFEILTCFYNENDWAKALDRSIPKRKGFILPE